MAEEHSSCATALPAMLKLRIGAKKLAWNSYHSQMYEAKTALGTFQIVEATDSRKTYFDVYFTAYGAHFGKKLGGRLRIEEAKVVCHHHFTALVSVLLSFDVDDSEREAWPTKFHDRSRGWAQYPD